MITTSRLHRYEFDLLPSDGLELISVMVELLENNSLLEKNSISSANDGEMKYHPELFNFSISEAIDIVIEHKQRKVDRVFLPHIEAFLMISYAVLMSWGFISNCLLCFVVTRQCAKRTMSNNGPSPRNLYIVNLAIADLLLCLTCMPFTLLSLMKRRWTFGPLMCKLVPLIQGSNVMVSSGTITAIALDRYFTIVRAPRRATCRCSVATILLLVWLMSFASMIPLVLFQQIETVKLGDLVLYEICLEKWPSSEMQKLYTLTLTTTQFVLPVVVLTTVHLKISLYLNVHLNGPPKSTIFVKRANREVRRNRRTMWILSCIAVVFIISWLPLAVFTIVVEFEFYIFNSPNTMYIAFVVCHILAMSSAATNPLLYGYLNTNFRRDLTGVCGLMCNVEDTSKQSSRRRRASYLIAEGHLTKEEGRSANTIEHHSVLVKSHDRRTSSSFGTTLTTTTTGGFSTRSSSYGVAIQPKVEEL